MNSPSTEIKETVLVVFARQLVDELRQINYADEWSKPPVSDVLPHLYKLLNLHSLQLGDIVESAYGNTAPTLREGNINQLATKYSDLFAKSEQHFLDLQAVESLRLETQVTNVNLADTSAADINANAKRILLYAAQVVVGTFANLNRSQENEHRTLEHVSIALTPVMYAYGLIGVGFDLSEYADQWRTLEELDRKRLSEEIIGRW